MNIEFALPFLLVAESVAIGSLLLPPPPPVAPPATEGERADILRELKRRQLCRHVRTSTYCTVCDWLSTSTYRVTQKKRIANCLRPPPNSIRKTALGEKSPPRRTFRFPSLPPPRCDVVRLRSSLTSSRSVSSVCLSLASPSSPSFALFPL